jgi:hypothetical protein
MKVRLLRVLRLDIEDECRLDDWIKECLVQLAVRSELGTYGVEMEEESGRQ